MMLSERLFVPLATFALAAGLQAAEQKVGPAANVYGNTDEGEEEITVTGRRLKPTPILEPIAYFRDYCFEANRLNRQSATPEKDPNWLPASEELRQKLTITDPAIKAYMLKDDARGHTLVLKVEQISKPDRLRENQCAVIVVGGTSHSSLKARMSALLRSPPVQESIKGSDGLDSASGWQHWIWTGMPGRRSKNWSVFKRDRQASSRWIIVIDPSIFYSNADYILADLKMKDGNPRISILSFSYTHRM